MKNNRFAARLFHFVIALILISGIYPVTDANAATVSWRDMIVWDMDATCVKQARHEDRSIESSCRLNFTDYSIMSEKVYSSGNTWTCENGKLVSDSRHSWIETPVIQLPSGDGVKNSLALTIAGAGESCYCVYICEKSVDSVELLEIGANWIDSSGIVDTRIAAYNLTKGTSTTLGTRNILIPTSYNGKEVYFIVWRTAWSENDESTMTVDDIKVRTTAAAPYVMFDANGGSCSDTVLYPDKYGRVSLPEPIPHSGCTFKGWATSVNGTENVTDETQFFTPVMLYAQYYITGVNVTGYEDPIVGEELLTAANLAIPDNDPVYRIVAVTWYKNNGKVGYSPAYALRDQNYQVCIECESIRDGYFVPCWDAKSMLSATVNGSAENVYGINVYEYEDRNTIGVITPNVTAQLAKYSVSVKNGTASVSSASEDTIVTITAYAERGSRFSSWRVISGNVTIENFLAPVSTFVMGTEDVDIIANIVADITDLDIFALPESLVSLRSEALKGTDPEVIIIPKACEYVSADAFDDCDRLIYIVNLSSLSITPPTGVSVLTEMPD